MTTSHDPTIDRSMLGSYLRDHLTGAEGGRSRVLDMAERYADRDFGPALAEVAEQIDDEHSELARIIDRLGMRQPLPARLVARAGEVVGRLKPNGRILSSTPVTPLLEVELMRSAVNGKWGLWQTLSVHADVLGLDRAGLDQRADQAQAQDETLSQVHAQLREEAFNPNVTS